MTNNTLIVSELAYEFETMRIELGAERGVVREVRYKLGDSYPSHLEYLDMDYESWTGTSGVAFRDKRTGEVIIAYTGTNPNMGVFSGEFGKDGVISDLIGIGAGTMHHVIPALLFYVEMRQKYGDDIVLTGHSLGGNVAQVVAVIFNVEKTVVYNAAPLTVADIFNVTPAQKLAKFIIEQFGGNTPVTYLNQAAEQFTGDIIRIRSEHDVLNLVTDVVPSKYVGEEYKIKRSGYHGLKAIVNSEQAQLEIAKITSKFYEPNIMLETSSLGTVDIDGDGITDLAQKDRFLYPANFFTAESSAIFINSDPITIDAPSLHRLARNIQSSVLADLKTIRTITEKCQAKNASIQTSFEERKTQVSEQIKDVLAKNALMSVFDGLDQSLNQLVKQVGLFETLAKPGQMSYPFSASETPYDGNRVLSLDRYEINLSILSTKASSLASSCQEETVGLFDGIFKRPSLLKSWKIIDEASRQLIKESDRVFEGTGLREGKADGISQSLNDVFEVQLPDIAELERLVLNTVELISGVANHFTTVDTWLGDNLKQGRFQGSAGPVSLPPSYQAYLERTGILDDVTGVLQAFDKQVEERCKAYAQKVGDTYTSVLSTLSAGLDRWQSESKALVNSTEAIEVTFSNPIDVETTRLVDKKTVTTRSYWGTLGSLYPSQTKSAVQSATTVLPPIVNRFDEVVNQVATARYRLQQMGQELRLIIEKGVYTAFDLDEIVSSQKIAAGLLQKMIVELQFVKTAIDSSMSGKAAKALVTHLGLLVQRLGYYEQLVSDCFGTQGSAIQSATGGQSSASKSFSLN